MWVESEQPLSPERNPHQLFPAPRPKGGGEYLPRDLSLAGLR
jgi:hypothetical protein